MVQIESICRRLNKCDQRIKICSGKGRKHCGKRRICWLPAFLVHQSMRPRPGGSVASVSNSMTRWLRVPSPVEATFLSGVFSSLTSAEACEESSGWLWKEKLCKYWCEKARKHICVTHRHHMTLAVSDVKHQYNQPIKSPEHEVLSELL